MSNFTSSWVQYCERRETGDSGAMTSRQERLSRDFSIPQLFFVCRGRKLCGRKCEMELLNSRNEIIQTRTTLTFDKANEKILSCTFNKRNKNSPSTKKIKNNLRFFKCSQFCGFKPSLLLRSSNFSRGKYHLLKKAPYCCRCMTINCLKQNLCFKFVDIYSVAPSVSSFIFSSFFFFACGSLFLLEAFEPDRLFRKLSH